MHDEELAVKILEEQKAMETSINPFRDSFDYMFTRHYYLSNEEENLLYRMDSIRAELELAVIHSELHSYRLEENLMTAFLCLFAMYIRLPITDRDKVSAYLREASKKTCKLSIE